MIVQADVARSDWAHDNMIGGESSQVAGHTDASPCSCHPCGGPFMVVQGHVICTRQVNSCVCVCGVGFVFTLCILALLAVAPVLCCFQPGPCMKVLEPVVCIYLVLCRLAWTHERVLPSCPNGAHNTHSHVWVYSYGHGRPLVTWYASIVAAMFARTYVYQQLRYDAQTFLMERSCT